MNSTDRHTKVPPNSLPNILLVTDDIPAPLSTGTTKTLYNLLKGYPGEKLCIFTEPGKHYDMSERLHGTLFEVRLGFLPQLSNRLGRLGYNRFAFWMNGWLSRLMPLPRITNLPVRPEIILLATIWHNRLVTAVRIGEQNGIPVVPYLLDFWPSGFNPTYGGLSFQQAVKTILSKASGWMVISLRLQRQLEQFFSIKAPPTLIIHNPAVVAAFRPRGKYEATPYMVAYAGSLFDMHYDTLVQTARAFSILRSQGLPVNMMVYCGKEHWTFRRGQLEPLGVSYGGFLNPDALMEELRKAGLLLVTASYAESERHYSACSLQTKVTEYMGSGVPIVSVGPAYGECNRFFLENHCGFVITEIEPEALALAFRNIWAKPQEMDAMAERAVGLAVGYYSQQQTQERLFNFLKHYA